MLRLLKSWMNWTSPGSTSNVVYVPDTCPWRQHNEVSIVRYCSLHSPVHLWQGGGISLVRGLLKQQSLTVSSLTVEIIVKVCTKCTCSKVIISITLYHMVSPRTCSVHAWQMKHKEFQIIVKIETVTVVYWKLSVDGNRRRLIKQ